MIAWACTGVAWAFPTNRGEYKGYTVPAAHVGDERSYTFPSFQIVLTDGAVYINENFTVLKAVAQRRSLHEVFTDSVFPANWEKVFNN